MDAIITYLRAHAQTPEVYVVGCFKRHAIVFLAEDHGLKHNLLLIHNLLPLLYSAGVYYLGMEFGAHEDQAELDELVTAETYDEARARRLMFNYNVGWAYREYLDIYRKAWELNRTLPAHARPFRILNLSYKYDWRDASVVRTPENAKRIFPKGSTEQFRAAVVKREILARNEKILILTGTPHAVTRYAMPIFDPHAEGFYRLDTLDFGNLLYAHAPEQVFTVLLHQPFPSQMHGGAELVLPANGVIDQVVAELKNRRVGFDLVGSPLGELSDTSYYATGHDNFQLKLLADGYIYDRPIAEYEGCALDDEFLTEANWPEAQAQFPNPEWHPRPRSLEEYWVQIRAYVDIPQRYKNLRSLG